MPESVATVTVVCIAYNQAKYIRQCMESIVSQKTDFPFELLIHDDCSTDGTTEIIREFEQNYPDIVKPLYEEENQYKKGNVMPSYLVLPHVKGEYVAFCEGDDYWDDPLKLQKQYDALQANPDCHMCVHRVKTVWENGEDAGISIPKKFSGTQTIPSKTFIRSVEDFQFHLLSFFFRGDDIRAYIQDLPTFAKLADVSDECYELYFGNLGNVYFIDETMASHRAGSIGCWNSRNQDEKRVKHHERMIAAMEAYDTYTQGNYHDVCEHYILHQHYHIATIRKDYKTQLKKENREFYQNYGWKYKLRLRLNALRSKPDGRKEN